jgi:hypothetical protein
MSIASVKYSKKETKETITLDYANMRIVFF